MVERGGPHLGLCQQYQPDVDTEEDEGGNEGGGKHCPRFRGPDEHAVVDESRYTCHGYQIGPKEIVGGSLHNGRVARHQ